MPSTLFTIPLWLDLSAVGIGAIQGAMFAGRFKDRRFDLLGVALIGIVVGLGGGLLRDVLLGGVPAALQSNWYLPVATGAALLGMLLQSLFDRLGPLIVGLDAVTIGLFGAIGTSKALAQGLPEIPALFVGVVSAVGGSALRDMMLNVPIAMMHVGS
ncbi:MAG TPA: TRIC cation channel family protein, partial [Cryobacterium sp.]|nr:TRIC cation channel family protein [Cryobacterium sp.]